MVRWILCVLTGLSLCAGAGEASADRIKKLTRRLAKSSSVKVRLSAALSLAKSDDARALRALRRSLVKDRSSAIRRISAGALGQRLRGGLGNGGRLSRSSREQVMSALKTVARRDRDAKVRASAKVALTKATMEAPSSEPARRSKGIMVGVLAPKNLSKRLPKNTAARLVARVKQVLNDKAPRSIRTAPGFSMPSRALLRSSGMSAYSVSPNISKLSVQRKGRRVFVRCEVKMRLAPWAGVGGSLSVHKSATVTGSGTISSYSSARAIEKSSQACIDAVVTQVTAAQVVPFLASQAR